MGTRERLVVGGAIAVAVFLAGVAMLRDSAPPATTAEQAVEAEMQRQGLRSVGRCPAGQSAVDAGSCFVFVAQGVEQCSFAVGPARSQPDRLISVTRGSMGWETRSVTRLDFFFGDRGSEGGTCTLP